MPIDNQNSTKAGLGPLDLGRPGADIGEGFCGPVAPHHFQQDIRDAGTPFGGFILSPVSRRASSLSRWRRKSDCRRFNGLARRSSRSPRLSASGLKSASICVRCLVVNLSARRRQRRSCARSRTRPTRRSRVVTPGRRILPAISQAQAHSIRRTGLSSPAQQNP